MGKINLSKKNYKATDTLKKNTGCVKIFGDLNGEETPSVLAYRIAIGIVFDEYDTIPKRLSYTLVSFLKAETFENTTTDDMIELVAGFVKNEVEKRFRLKSWDVIRDWFANDDYINVPTLIDFVLNENELTPEETRIFRYAIDTDIASQKDDDFDEGYISALLATNDPTAIIEMVGNAEKDKFGVRFDKCYDDEGNVYYEYSDILGGSDPECPELYHPTEEDAEEFLREHVWTVIVKNAEEKYGVIA